jgi:signal transduction histidine kinase
MKLSARRRSFILHFRPAWYLDALLFWSVFSSCTIFLLWLLNSTTKTGIRTTIEQRIQGITLMTAGALNPELFFGETPATTPNQNRYLARIHPFVQAMLSGNDDVTGFKLVVWSAGRPQVYIPGARGWVAESTEGIDSRGWTAVQAAQSTGQIQISAWSFLHNRAFFFFTPPASGPEYSVTLIPGWGHLPAGERPVALLEFDASRMRDELATVDTNSINIICVAVLLATAISVILRRRSIQQAEAVEHKLAAMKLLGQRDNILAAAVRAADRFITETSLTEPVRQLLEATLAVVPARQAVFVRYRRPGRPSLELPVRVEAGPPGAALEWLEKEVWESAAWSACRSELEKGHPVILGRGDAGWWPRDRVPVKGAALFPILVGDQWVGLLALLHPQDLILPEAGLVDTLRLTADLLGAAIERRENEFNLLASSKMEALGRMASGVAHEFNNLLHIVSGNLALMAEGDERSAAKLANIREAVQRGSRIVDQLLRATRQSSPDLKPVQLNELVEKTVSLIRPALRKSVALELDLDSVLPVAAMDESQIQQVLLNILLNAHDAVENEGGMIRVSTRRLDKSDPGGAKSYVVCTVEDNGPGIPPEIMKSIFDPFFTTKPPGTGTGLGLSTSRGILERHGGQLEAANRPERGACFTFFIPATPMAPPVKPTSAIRPAPKVTRTVAVIDDEPLCLQLLVEILQENGFRPVSMSDGRQLIEAIARGGQTWDCIVTDWTMPGLAGAALVSEIRRHLPKIRIVVTSGFLIDPHQMTGVDAVLQKPFQPEELVILLEKLVAGPAGFPTGSPK